MIRQATKSRPRDDLEHAVIDDENEAALASLDDDERLQPHFDEELQPAAEADDISHYQAELAAIETAAKPKRKGGFFQLVVIALVGMAIGFAAVMMI